MKVFDIVQVDDGSWSKAIVAGTMEHVSGNSLRNRQFCVLAKGGEYPTEDHGGVYGVIPQNNIILVDVNNSLFILFSRQSFCRVLEPLAPSRALVAAIKTEAAASEVRSIACKAANDASDQYSFACEAHRASVKALDNILKALDAS